METSMTTALTKPLAGVGEDGRHLYTCPLCEAMCGLEIHVSDGRVASVRGNHDDTWSHGHICPKGATLGALHEDPDRIRRPMIKVDGQWQEVSWDAAFRRCTELLAPVIEKHGIGAVTCYTGNPLAHSFSLGRYTGVLLGMSGIPISYSPGTVDQWPKNLSSHLMYGGWWSFPVPDIERTDLLIVMGANPAASQGSLLAAPNVMGIIDAIRKRGKVIVVDPVHTATAARADEWLPITPGTDAALLLAVVHTLFRGEAGQARRHRGPPRRRRPHASGGRRVVTGARRRCHRHHCRAHSHPGASAGGHRARRRVRPNWPV
jgi:anaerobic selenocysteine-containing dehydrogenase